MPIGPDPATRFPLPGTDRLGFLKNFIRRPNRIVVDYPHYDDPRGPGQFGTPVPSHFTVRGEPPSRAAIWRGSSFRS